MSAIEDELDYLIDNNIIKSSQRRQAKILIKIRNRYLENKKGKGKAYTPYEVHQNIKVEQNAQGHFKRQDVPNFGDDYVKVRGPMSGTSGMGLLRKTIFGGMGYLKAGQYGQGFDLIVKNIGKIGVKHGNNKPIPSWIMILNTSPAIDCATRHCGECGVNEGCEFYQDCYALGNEAQSMRQYSMVAGLGLVANAKRKSSALVRKMIHEADPWDFANAVLKSNGKKAQSNLNATRFVRWNEAGDVKDSDELFWIGQAAGYLGLGIVIDKDGKPHQKYWGRQEKDIQSVKSTIYTHRTKLYKNYLKKVNDFREEIEKETDEERKEFLKNLLKSMEDNFTIMGSGFMASNEFRAVDDFSKDPNNVDLERRGMYTMINGDIYSVSRDADGNIIQAEDGDLRMEDGLYEGAKLFPVYHCSSNCELCQEQYGVALCYATDLRGAIVEEKKRYNDDSIRNMVDRNGMMDANNPNNYMDNFTTVRDTLATPQKKDVMFDVLYNGTTIKDKKTDLPDSVYFDWNTGEYKDYQNSKDYEEAFGDFNFGELAYQLYQERYVALKEKEKREGRLLKKDRDKMLSMRDLAYIQHYINYGYREGVLFAHDRPLTQQEWDKTYPNGIEINPESWKNLKSSL